VERLACIQDVVPHPQWSQLGSEPCLGFKYTVSSIGLPYDVRDDGYVITNAGGEQYFPLTDDQIHHLQSIHQLPTPLPAYSIPLQDRLLSMLTWVTVTIALGVAVWKLWRRRRLARERTETRTETTVRVLKRSRDRQIDAAFAPVLQPGETISHQAVARDREPGGFTGSFHTYWLALTDRRLLILGYSVRSFRAIDRTDIVGIQFDHERLYVRTRQDVVQLIVPFSHFGYSKDNQRGFLRDAPRLAPYQAPPAARVVSPPASDPKSDATPS
jgi:hypothetical protein